MNDDLPSLGTRKGAFCDVPAFSRPASVIIALEKGQTKIIVKAGKPKKIFKLAM